MKKLILTVAFFIAVISLSARAEARVTRVRPYYKPSTGTYVAPHFKTSPDSTKFDNFSTRGNSNPFTGKKGYASPDKW